jgi:hypothetical protein
MAKLIYNQDLNMVYPAPEDGRELKSYEYTLQCPACGFDDMTDLRAAKFFPPFVCGDDETGCGTMFTLDEIRDSYLQRVY